jgi:hypothetical protein
MLKSRVIYEGARTGLYSARGARSCKGRQQEMTASAQVAHVVARVRPLVKA